MYHHHNYTDISYVDPYIRCSSSMTSGVDCLCCLLRTRSRSRSSVWSWSDISNAFTNDMGLRTTPGTSLIPCFLLSADPAPVSAAVSLVLLAPLVLLLLYPDSLYLAAAGTPGCSRV